MRKIKECFQLLPFAQQRKWVGLMLSGGGVLNTKCSNYILVFANPTITILILIVHIYSFFHLHIFNFNSEPKSRAFSISPALWLNSFPVTMGRASSRPSPSRGRGTYRPLVHYVRVLSISSVGLCLCCCFSYGNQHILDF